MQSPGFVSRVLPDHFSAEGARRLDALRAGLEQLMELCCLWLPRVGETRVKIQLGKEIWYLAAAADVLRRRVAQLPSPHLSNNADSRPLLNGLYTTALNLALQTQGTSARLYLLHELFLLDISKALKAQHTAASSVCDQPTEDALDIAISYTSKQLAWYSACRAEQAGIDPTADIDPEVLELWGRCGGVRGDGLAPLTLEEARLASTNVELQVGPVVEVPAREECLTVLDRTPPFPPGTQFGSPIALHTVVFVIEICAAEICCTNIVAHRDAPWGLRMDMARQTWDEVRHAQALLDRCEELGGHVGMHPIDMATWRMYSLAECLPEKLMMEQRLGEGRGLDAGYQVFLKTLKDNDEITARIFDYLSADEINHVSNGNRWIKHLIGDDQARLQLLERTAYDKLEANGLSWTPPPPWKAGRLAAGFSEAEVTALLSRREQLLTRVLR